MSLSKDLLELHKALETGNEAVFIEMQKRIEEQNPKSDAIQIIHL